MKCPNCGGQMGLEDAVCPYCNTPNAMAAKHQSDMAHFRQEYQRTQADVMQKTSFMQRHGSWLIVLSVLLVALIGGIVLQAGAWDIGHSIRTRNVERGMVEASQVMDSYLEAGDYGKFLGYYDANNISLDYENPYQGLRSAANAYVNLIRDISTLNDPNRTYSPEHLASVYGYLAEDLNRIFTLEEQFTYNTDKYLPADKRVYIEDIRDRSTAIAKAYFGLTDEQIRDIPNMSTKRLAKLIEEGIAS